MADAPLSSDLSHQIVWVRRGMLRLSTSVSYQIISSTHSLFLRHSFNISQRVIIFSSEKSYTQKLFNQEAENIVIAENN